ncbi:hypothetical protein KV337_004715 [Escherichia coli]|nr:hypothetical protein [Salmonella enterica subsp. enterica serovar Montevideo]EHJ5855155.1 hypothetical protein [Escherichia coli]EHK8186510.1 hypothetical protein [Salmonella enterica subsp. enterica serovar Chester]EHM2532686.1 hypothetical protein [Salmonella enterica subsp. enterica serovar Newport]EHM4996010.1 hypothetical protein [Shigella sonnei]EHN8122608.1 hypothetical protein [Shigella dysenteriae]EHR4802088.1 hypothetical protein [Salmonella enterica]EHX1738432.1 hypothetical pr
MAEPNLIVREAEKG